MRKDKTQYSALGTTPPMAVPSALQNPAYTDPQYGYEQQQQYG